MVNYNGLRDMLADDLKTMARYLRKTDVSGLDEKDITVLFLFFLANDFRQLICFMMHDLRNIIYNIDYLKGRVEKKCEGGSNLSTT